MKNILFREDNKEPWEVMNHTLHGICNIGDAVRDIEERSVYSLQTQFGNITEEMVAEELSKIYPFEFKVEGSDKVYF